MAETASALLKKSYVRGMFDKMAGYYDRFCAWTSLGMDARWRRLLARKVLNSADVLDLCTGTGAVARALLEAPPAGRRVTAVDFSFPMLKEALRRTNARGAIRYCLADAESLPFPDAAFDAVTCAFSFRNISQLDLCLAEIRRVTRPGGILAVLDLTRPSKRTWSRIYFSYMGRIMIALGRSLSGSRAPFLYLHQSIQDFETPEELTARIGRAGFSKAVHQPAWGGIVGFFTAVR